ncbi:MAG: N-acetylmuramoyl-L-alanine amidase [bacterium]|nr:N-acetylmuramoyl-L-alanine amidase [bacterium]
MRRFAGFRAWGLAFSLMGAAAPSHAQPRTAPAASGGPTEVAPFVLVLDPGHGGREAGSQGVGSVLEKNITFQTVKLLAGRLSKWPQIRVVLTREGDTEVTPVQRTAVANYNGAALFLSIHVDASWTPGLRGASILIAAPQRPPRMAGEPADAVALRWQRGQNVHLSDSLRFATGLRDSLQAIEGAGKVPIRVLTLRTLESAKMPAAYFSLGVLSTPEEVARLRELKADSPLISALVRTIVRFAGLPEEPPAVPEKAPAAGSGGSPGGGAGPPGGGASSENPGG